MLKLLFFAISAFALPVVINKSTDGRGFEWIRPYLRQIWTGIAAFYSLYLLCEPVPVEVTVKLHKYLASAPALGYLASAVVGASLLCGYWWFTGKEFSSRVSTASSSAAIGTRPAETDRVPTKNEPAYSVADVKVVCDDTSARIEVTNRGARALFSVMLSIKGEVKPLYATGLHCRWEGSNLEEINIAKGQMRRLIVADRRHYAPTSFPDKGITYVHHGTWWGIHALADGMPVLMAGSSGPHASDIILTIEIIANPDFKDGVKRSKITLTPSKAVGWLNFPSRAKTPFDEQREVPEIVSALHTKAQVSEREDRLRLGQARSAAEVPELLRRISEGLMNTGGKSESRRGFEVTCGNHRLDNPRSETYRIRVSNRAVSTIDDVRIRVMSITGAPELSGVLPISLREQHGKEAPFTLNNTSIFIDLLEWSDEKMPGAILLSRGTDGKRVSRRLQYAFLCNDSKSPRVMIDCGEGSIHQIGVEVQGRDVPTCLKTFRVRSLFPERGPDGAGLEVTEV